MKKNSILFATGMAIAVAGMIGCKRDFSLVSPVHGVDGMAQLHIVDASPNFRKVYGQADSFNVLVNGVKATAFTPGTAYVLTYNSNFPTVSSGYGYVSVAPGQDAIKLSVAGTVNPDSIPIITLNKTLQPNQLYSLIITDSLSSGRDSSQIFVQDVYQQPTTGFYNLRFVHAVLNDTAGKAIDVWSTRSNRYLFTGIKPGTVTAFTQYPYNGLYSDTLYVRRTGTGQGLDTLNSVNFSNQRTYTLYFKGNAGSNSNADIRRRKLATYVHQ